MNRVRPNRKNIPKGNEIRANRSQDNIKQYILRRPCRPWIFNNYGLRSKAYGGPENKPNEPRIKAYDRPIKNHGPMVDKGPRAGQGPRLWWKNSKAYNGLTNKDDPRTYDGPGPITRGPRVRTTYSKGLSVRM
ncbi:hypothetical protein ElyMa_000838800 [Elysia marginata]|uniref:Uncharacterized protein n=1 Tax=Elysia marginata TaxID=1093978 RepID=A0AAV4H2J7_9GAST|nr:hypothetical protein ElyMa_000838800 [Elysia marginata]